jgi:hypothetical protein
MNSSTPCESAGVATLERYTPEPAKWIGQLDGGLLVPEMVDLMLEGLVCEECGTLLEDAVGYPRRCKACEDVQGQEDSAGGEDAGEETPFD